MQLCILCDQWWYSRHQQSVWAASLQRMPKPVKSVKLVTDMESSSCQILKMICRCFGLHCLTLLLRTQNPQHNSQPMWLNISQGPGSDAGIPLKTSEMGTWMDMNPWNKHALNSVSCPGSQRMQRHLKGIGHLMEILCKTLKTRLQKNKKNRFEMYFCDLKKMHSVCGSVFATLGTEPAAALARPQRQPAG